MRKVPVDCYSRVVGYFQPVRLWNKGKQEEFRERLPYNLHASWRHPAFAQEGISKEELKDF
jgi:hypothetical protein